MLDLRKLYVTGYPTYDPPSASLQQKVEQGYHACSCTAQVQQLNISILNPELQIQNGGLLCELGGRTAQRL